MLVIGFVVIKRPVVFSRHMLIRTFHNTRFGV
jgi:hypothetical protein